MKQPSDEIIKLLLKLIRPEAEELAKQQGGKQHESKTA